MRLDSDLVHPSHQPKPPEQAVLVVVEELQVPACILVLDRATASCQEAALVWQQADQGEDYEGFLVELERGWSDHPAGRLLHLSRSSSPTACRIVTHATTVTRRIR